MVEAKKTTNIFADIDSELPDEQLSKLFLEKILEKSVDVSDPLYKISFQRTYKVNFDVSGHTGYQLYEPSKYSYKYDEFLDDPDFTFIYKDIEYIRELLRGEKSRPALARDKNNVLQICRKEDLFIAHTKAEVGNAQLFIVKIPFFKEIIEDLGASQQTLPLRDEPEDPISPIKEGEIALLMKDMLVETAEMPEELYQKNFKGQPMKINWEINGNIAYQHFAEDGYKYEFGKHIEDADVTLTFPNTLHAKRFLSKIPGNYAARIVDKKLSIYYKKAVLSVIFKDRDASAMAIGMFPFYRELGKIEVGPQVEDEEKDTRENYGHYIPVNLPLGDFENVAVPYKVFEYFINKASNIVLRTCPCRERYECKNHSIELGCIFMGDDTKNMVLPEGHGYVATKEQALEHLTKAMAEGLVPLLGRNVAEAEGGHGVEDTGKFLSGCFCCECCCIAVKYAQYGLGAGAGTGMGGDNPGPLEGMTITLDEEKCTGCGKCVEVCPFNLRILKQGKSSVDPKLCVGCGRCVKVCPEKAISFDIQDQELIDKFIAKIESIVDVEDNSLKAQ
ncbi:MAG: 4Fe-4S dicluster domain-containing protein [Candidatus Lokiarchaeota archaeon]|nr:4Fe-4S dicluster domain-containing protein [Candidatus Lokiarchaeota archaeon]